MKRESVRHYVGKLETISDLAGNSCYHNSMYGVSCVGHAILSDWVRNINMILKRCAAKGGGAQWDILSLANAALKNKDILENYCVNIGAIMGRILMFKLTMIKIIIDLLDVPENAVNLAENHLEILNLFKNNIQEILRENVINADLRTIITQGFAKSYARIESKLYFVDKVKVKRHEDFQNFIHIEEDNCSVCLDVKLTKHSDYSILSSCKHRYCVPCTEVWLKKG